MAGQLSIICQHRPLDGEKSKLKNDMSSAIQSLVCACIKSLVIKNVFSVSLEDPNKSS